MEIVLFTAAFMLGYGGTMMFLLNSGLIFDMIAIAEGN